LAQGHDQVAVVAVAVAIDLVDALGERELAELVPRDETLERHGRAGGELVADAGSGRARAGRAGERRIVLADTGGERCPLDHGRSGAATDDEAAHVEDRRAAAAAGTLHVAAAYGAGGTAADAERVAAGAT